ncbi:MAG: hypothetical protein ABIH08_04390 [Candidatus Omnitrophota bacterium]
MKNNYAFTLVKLVLFLIIFCFFTELTLSFWHQIKTQIGFNINILIFSVVAFFSFSEFIANLNGFYKKVQSFFFRSSQLMILFPALLIISGIGYFLLPKILNTSFNKDIFTFLGGFILTSHLCFIAKEIKGHTFSTFINYMFVFSILYILNLIFLGVYLKVAFNIQIGKIIIEGARNGTSLIQYIFAQVFS